MIADPVLADLIREDARQTLAENGNRRNPGSGIRRFARLNTTSANIGDLITDLAENDCDCVVDRLQWLLKTTSNLSKRA